jgi:hypothetical protein
MTFAPKNARSMTRKNAARDLPVLRPRRVINPHPRTEPELHGLHRQRVRAGDDGLRRNNGGGRRERDERVERPCRREQVERVLRGRGLAKEQRTLAEVIEQQRRQDNREPADADRGRAEMPHIGVQRLAAGDHEEDGAEDDVAVPAVAEEEGGTLRGVDGRKHGRVPQDLRGAERREHEEPDERDGSEDRPDAGGPAPLEEEQRDEDRDRDRHDVRSEDWCRDGQPFNRAQHRDSGRDDAVPVEERRTEDPQQDQHRVLALARRLDRRRERREREDAPLAVIVGP